MIIVDIIDKWPRPLVTGGDIVAVRDKVMRNYFTTPTDLSDSAVIFAAGEAWEEMLFLHLYLDYVNSQKVKGRNLSRSEALKELIERQLSLRVQPPTSVCDDEFHFIAEWLKENRHDSLVTRNSFATLRNTIATEIYDWCRRNGSFQKQMGEVFNG